ncbi:MAG TPA: outer membrane lipoprotein carrier protein LolA [Gemmatirosa sp.]
MTFSFRFTTPALAAVALAASLTASPARAQDPASAAIDRAAQAFRAARTIHATFEQTLSNPATGTTNTTSGDLSLAQPNRVALRFNNAGGDRVILDGRTAWVYLPSAVPGQVMKLPARSSGIAGVESVSELLTSPRSKYAVADGGTATVSGHATRVVVLTPKADGQPVTKARVWVDDQDGAVRQLELTDANGLVRSLRMTTWEPNAKLAPSTFTFEVPSGVRVVDRATAAAGR